MKTVWPANKEGLAFNRVGVTSWAGKGSGLLAGGRCGAEFLMYRITGGTTNAMTTITTRKPRVETLKIMFLAAARLLVL
jgi:hypothetical protein